MHESGSKPVTLVDETQTQSVCECSRLSPSNFNQLQCYESATSVPKWAQIVQFYILNNERKLLNVLDVFPFTSLTFASENWKLDTTTSTLRHHTSTILFRAHGDLIRKFEKSRLTQTKASGKGWKCAALPNLTFRVMLRLSLCLQTPIYTTTKL